MTKIQEGRLINTEGGKPLDPWSAHPRRVPTSQVKVPQRTRKDLGDIEAFAARMLAVGGQLEPIVVDPDMHLIAGERRLRACQHLGWDVDIVVTASAKTELERLDLEWAENDDRKDFTPEERLRYARRRQELETAAAAERKREGQAKGGDVRAAQASGIVVPEACANDEGGRAKTRAAKAAGFPSRKAMEATETTVQAAEADPVKYGPYLEELNRTGRATGIARRLKVAKQADALQAEPPPLPTGPFRVLVVDPPWSYEKRSQNASQRGRTPYPPMTVEEISAMPVGEMAHPDGAVLWLWVTNAHLLEVDDQCRSTPHRILAAWGFTPKTMLTWRKDRLGTGDWLRGKTEHCILAVRGRPTVTLSNQTTDLGAPHPKDHSAKPEEFYELVEELCPGSKIEVFSRTNRPGWTTYGDEAGTIEKNEG